MKLTDDDISDMRKMSFLADEIDKSSGGYWLRCCEGIINRLTSLGDGERRRKVSAAVSCLPDGRRRYLSAETEKVRTWSFDRRGEALSPTPISVNAPTCKHGKMFLEPCPECRASERWNANDPRSTEPEMPAAEKPLSHKNAAGEVVYPAVRMKQAHFGPRKDEPAPEAGGVVGEIEKRHADDEQFDVASEDDMAALLDAFEQCHKDRATLLQMLRRQPAPDVSAHIASAVVNCPACGKHVEFKFDRPWPAFLLAGRLTREQLLTMFEAADAKWMDDTVSMKTRNDYHADAILSARGE